MITLPQKPDKKPLSVEVEEGLLRDVKKQVKVQKLKIRDAVEYGLKVFLEASKASKK